MKNWLLILSLLFLPAAVFSKKHFTFSPLAEQAYEAVLSLRFQQAQALIKRIKKEDPENLMVFHLENYMDFFKVYINENETEFRNLEKNKDIHLEKIKEGDPTSPYYLFLQANIRLHWALARLKFEEYLTAFREVSKAHELLLQNVKKFPDFMPNKKDLGILHAMVGTIPDNYKWGVELLTGLEGTIDQGRSEIAEVLAYAKKQPFIYEKETMVVYAYVLLHLDNDATTAWEILKSQKLDPTANPLACFTLANVAMHTGRNDEAIRLLENRPAGPEFFSFPYLDYMLGICKLRRLDADANTPLQQFLKRFKGRHFIKEAYQKLAWHALINGKKQQFAVYTQSCKSRGYTVVGSDKNAFDEANSNVMPDVSLLKARLLFDGGYYKRAYAELQLKSSSQYKEQRLQLEFTYRMGRILHKLGRHNEAFRFYHDTIEKGKTAEWYFACNAALQCGLLFEQLKNYKKAKEYFTTCLGIYPAEHRTGLHQQAKAGLVRLKKRN